MRRSRRIGPLAVLLVCGCAAWSLVPPGRHEIHGYHVVTPVAWSSRTTSAGDELWTIDGVRLQELRFSRVDDEDPLFAWLEKDPPLFHSHLGPSEIVDFVIDSLARIGLERIEASDLRPASFGAHDGVGFRLSFQEEDGLEMSGLARAAVIDGKLHLILYTGTRLHHYGLYEAEVERILDSIETRPSG